MSTSYLYHTMGLRQYHHLRTEYLAGMVYFHVSLKDHLRRCRNCKARWHELRLNGTFERTFFALPIGLRPQFVVLHGHEQQCLRCGQCAREPIYFAQGQKRHLKAFARLVLDLCKIMTLKAVATLLGVGWDMVKQIHKNYLEKKWAAKKKKLHRVRYIAIDELSIGKGHHYVSIVMDLETGEILHVQEGKHADAVIPFLHKLKQAGNLKAVATDLSGAYRSAVRQVFADTVDQIFDPYHVVALVNQAIDQTRRDLVRQADQEQKALIKGSRYLLLQGLEKVNEGGLERLLALMEVNAPLYEAYLLKEDLRTFWSLPANHAKPFLQNWIHQAHALGGHFQRLAKTLDNHRQGLLCYFKHRISSGPLEGLNNKIRTLMKTSYGYRDRQYFKLRLYFLHEKDPGPFPTP